MEDQGLVSIVVPVYNVERYLSACLDSLVGQTYKHIEILLIDDGSTDRSGVICDDYAKKDDRIRVFHKKNNGVSAARNDGIREAKGTYLLFVDSDDQIHCQMVDIYMEYAKTKGILLCEIVSDINLLNKRYDSKEETILDKVNSEKFMQLFCDGYINSPVNKFYITRVLRENQILFPEEKSLGEDLLFNLEYLRCVSGEYYIIRCPLYFYREDRNGSLSTSYRSDLFTVQKELFAALKCFLEDMDIWNEANQKMYYGIYWDRLYLTIRICRAYENVHSEEYHLKMILTDPIWHDIWIACKRRKLINWKRRIKAITLKLYQWTR